VIIWKSQLWQLSFFLPWHICCIGLAKNAGVIRTVRVHAAGKLANVAQQQTRTFKNSIHEEERSFMFHHGQGLRDSFGKLS